MVLLVFLRADNNLRAEGIVTGKYILFADHLFGSDHLIVNPRRVEVVQPLESTVLGPFVKLKIVNRKD